MKRLITSAVVCLFAAGMTYGDLYNDAVGDLHDGSGGGTDFTGFPHIDIVSLEIVNDANNITFTMTLNADISTATGTDWGKYMIGIDFSSSAPGDSAGNGWGRPINMPDGMDYWLGSWVDAGGGVQLWDYNDTAPGTWQNPGGSVGVDLSQAASGIVSFSVALADMGLSAGDTILFDAYSSGGNGTDSAVDALSSATPSVTDWPGPFTSPGSSTLNSYTITSAIPEPSTFLLLGAALGMLGLVRLRRR